MKKYLIVCVVSLLFVVGFVNVISLNGEVGSDYINLGFGMGINIGGLVISGNWVCSDYDGDIYGLGLGFNFLFGLLMVIIGGKGIYMLLEDGSSGGVVVIGGGLIYLISKLFILYGEGYFVFEELISGMKFYSEVNGGLCWNVFCLLIVDVGYCYINMEGKDGYWDNCVVDGVYIGVGLVF